MGGCVPPISPSTGSPPPCGAGGRRARPSSLPLAGSVDDGDRLVDVVDLLALDAFVTGREPYGRTKYLENVRADAPLTTEDARVVRDAVEEDGHGRLVVGEGWTLHVTRWKQSRRARVTVTAVSAELAESVLAAVGRRRGRGAGAGRRQRADRLLALRPARPAPGAAGDRRRAVGQDPRRTTPGRSPDTLERLMAAGRLGRSTAGSCCCTASPAPARPPRCGRWPSSGARGARSTACSTRSACSATRRT